MAEDPLVLIDSEIFIFDDELGKLTISTTNRDKIGLFQFLIKERSIIAPTVDMFTTYVSVTVVDFCINASLSVESSVLELTYMAGDD